MQEFRTKKKLSVFIQANCQSHAIRNIFQKVDRLSDKYEIIDVKPVHLWKDEDKEEIIEKISECDIFLHQPIDKRTFGFYASENLLQMLKPEAKSVSFPNLYFTGYHPQAFYLKDDDGRKVSEPFDYHDRNIVEFFKHGLSTEEILEKIEDESFYSEEEIKENIEQSLKALREREQYTDIKVSNYIEENMIGNKLFHIFNHPTNEMLFYLFNKVLELLDEDLLQMNEKQAFKAELLGATRYPIYKSLQSYFQINKAPLTLTIGQQTFTLKQMIKKYLDTYLEKEKVQNMDNINISSILCNIQLKNVTEYVSIAKYLLKNGKIDLAKQVIKTASVIFPLNKALKLIKHDLNIQSSALKNKRKVFAIGLSRTATNSLTHALEELGFSCGLWVNKETGNILEWKDVFEYDALSDTPISFIFETLYYAFPDAYFIYTTREKDSWVKSMNNHFKWTDGFDGFKKTSFEDPEHGKGLVKNPLWKMIHRNLYANSNSWSDAYDSFDKRVKNFFNDKPQAHFLEIDLTSSDDDKIKWEQLSTFLNLNNYPLKPFPKKNIRLQKVSNQKDSKELGSIIDIGTKISHKIFKELSIEGNVQKYSNPAEEKLVLKPPLNNSQYYIYNIQEFERPATTIYTLDDVFLSINFNKPYRTDCYLFNNNKEFIGGFSRGDEPFLLEEFIEIEKTIGFIDDKFTKFNVCHFLFDKLTRTEELSKSSIDSFLVFSQNDYTKYFFNILNLDYLDIEKYKNKMSNKAITFRFKRFVVSTSSTSSFRHPAQNFSSFAQVLIEKLKNTIPTTEKKYKIFIDRSGTKTRRMINDKEIREYLESHGFMSVRLEDLEVSEQLRLFRNAKYVIGTHGAGLSNIAFCEEGTKVIEILPPLCATQAFWKTAMHFKLDYNTVLAKDLEIEVSDYSHWKHEPAKYNGRDIIVPLEDLKRVL